MPPEGHRSAVSGRRILASPAVVVPTVAVATVTALGEFDGSIATSVQQGPRYRLSRMVLNVLDLLTRVGRERSLVRAAK
jgi:hypothetical protein